MVLDAKLLQLVACPRCHQSLELIEAGQALLCSACELKYPVRNDVPYLLAQEAINLRKISPQKLPYAPAHRFHAQVGSAKAFPFQLEQRTCMAIGRLEDVAHTTQVFHVDLALALDERSKTLIMTYIEKQFQKPRVKRGKSQGELGQFRRVPDLGLADASLSKLHVMLFADSEGKVGILDLVSKNGTYVNGEEVESRLLVPQDVVELGETRIVFED